MKKKVLFILHLPPPMHGPSVVGKYLKNSLLINELFDCRFVNLSTSRSVDEMGKKNLQKVFRYWRIIWKGIYLFIFWRPNLCYVSITVRGNGLYKDAIIVMLSKLFRIKLLYHLHNKGVMIHQDKYLMNLLYRYIFRFAQVIVLSRYLYEDIRKYVNEDNVHYCPNGIPNIKSAIQVKTKPNKVKILFLSNMIESKGVFVLLDALKILHIKRVPFQGVFIGNWKNISPERFSSYVNKAELNKNIVYLGSKYGVEKDYYLTTSDIFVLPTYNDCFPLVLLEAMQFSLPIVSTFEGGIPEIVEDGKTGYLVKQHNPESLANKLEILIHNSNLRQQFGAAGKQRFESRYTFSIFEKQIAKILSLNISASD